MNMRYIVFSGIDGCGKSSIIRGVQESLRERGIQSSVQWLRFNHLVCKVLHAFARVVGLSRKRQMSEGGLWRHEFYRSPLFCFVYIRAAYVDTLLGKVKALFRAKKTGTPIVICDRWIPDILVDLAVACRRPELLSGKWKERFFRLLPKKTLLLCVVREEQAILECRAENREDPDFSFRLEQYEKLLRFPEITEIDNRHALAESVKYAVDAICEFQERG